MQKAGKLPYSLNLIMSPLDGAAARSGLVIGFYSAGSWFDYGIVWFLSI